MAPVHGKDRILMFRKLSEAGSKVAAKLALQTSHSFNYSRSTQTTETKDGGLVSQGGLETTLEISAITSNDELNNMLKNSVIKSEKMEVWEIDLSTRETAYVKTTDMDIVSGKTYYTRTGVEGSYVYAAVETPSKGSLGTYYEETGEYDALYAQGNLESWQTPADVGEYANISTNMRIDGVPQEGKVILPPEQEAEVLYVFRDIDAYVEE